MACSCCKSCFAILAIALVALWYHGCSLHSVLQTLSAFPVVGPFLIENSLVVPRTRPTTATSSDDAAANERLFTAEELWEYRGGENSKGLYLACIGLVYDVQKGERHYAPGKHYHGFVGRDGSRSFITGNFTDAGLVDDVSDFSGMQLVELKKWIDRYPKDYPYVGKLIGRYYDANGQPTEALNKLMAAIENAPHLIKLEEDLKTEFPGCNSYFLLSTGGRFWCDTESGHVKREKPGFPRRFVLPETGAVRCVCAQEHQLNDPRLAEYPDCPKDALECHLKTAPPHTEL